MRQTALGMFPALFLLLLATDARAQWGFTWEDQHDWTFQISSAQVRQGIEGGLLWGDGVGNTELDVEGVLDFDDATTLAGRIDFQPATGAHLGFSYLPLEFSGDTVLTAAEVVNGISYAAGDQVKSEFELDGYRAQFGYRFRLTRHLVIEPLVQVDLLDGLLDTVDVDLAGAKAEEEFLVPIALAGLRLEFYPIPRLALFAEAKGFTASSWGELTDATATDGEAGVAINLTKNVVLIASYHRTDFEFDVSQTEVDLELSGVTVSMNLRF